MTAARLFGKIIKWGNIFGIAFMLVGLLMMIVGNSYVPPSEIINSWTKGTNSKEFWMHVGKDGSGYWFLKYPAYGDTVGMIGITSIAVTMLIGLFSLLKTFISSRSRDIFYALVTLALVTVIMVSILGLAK